MAARSFKLATTGGCSRLAWPIRRAVSCGRTLIRGRPAQILESPGRRDRRRATQHALTCSPAYDLEQFSSHFWANPRSVIMYARYIPPSKGAKSSVPVEAASSSRGSSSFTGTMSEVTPRPVDGYAYARYVPGAKTATPAGSSTAVALSQPKAIQYFHDEPSPIQVKRKRDTASEPQDAGSERRKREKTQVAAMPGLDAQPGQKKKKNRRKRKKRTAAADDTSDESDESDMESQNDSAKKLSKSSHPKHAESSVGKEPDTNVAVEAPPAVNGDSPSKTSDVDMQESAGAEAHETEPETQLKEEKPKKEKRREKKKKDAMDKTTVEDDAEENEREMARHKAVLERKSKSLKIAHETAQATRDESEEELEESHGLEPLPQPAPVPEDVSKPTYDTMPSWLLAPIRVSQNTRAPFTDLGISHRPSRLLAKRGFSDAFAVQTAAIPLLLPTSKQRPGDLLVSAATGSGKTLAYALPIVRDISNGLITRTRALVVLPTRELVKQAQEVFEVCAKAFDGEHSKRVRIGIAIGSQSIKSEQEALVGQESRYDPAAYEKILEGNRQKRAQNLASSDVDDVLDYDSMDNDPRLGPWKGEVVDFSSKVDVLICTPGRLVEHIEQTPGFSLDYVRWLVVDEADKLLAQSFQGWLDVVLEKFRVNNFSARDFPDMAYSGVRKVILSATLTRDLSLLNQLSLRRPQLIVLESDGAVEQVAEHTLPTSLREFAVRVHETNLKPLYLLDLLRGGHMKRSDVSSGDASSALKEDKDTDSDDGSSSSSSSSAGSDTSDSDSDSDDSSDTSSESDGTSDSGSSSDGETKPPASLPQSQLPISLIFTKSNESALRLSRLLALLDPSLASQISTLTSTTPTHTRRKVLRAFTTPSSAVRLIVASDLVARGIDLPKLEHVINYDLPASLAGYVHRVGRTARAGRAGCSWTLVGDDESGWFWGKIAKNKGVRRAQKLERVMIDEMAEERIQEYEGALAKLGKEALELRRKR